MTKLFIFLIFAFTSISGRCHESKALICGVCKNVGEKINNTIDNLEAIGNRLLDYRIIIYENNSTNNTKHILRERCDRNSKIICVSEDLAIEELSVNVLSTEENGLPCRMELIASARNKLLEIIKDSQFDTYPFVIMNDLDLKGPWPVDEIINTLNNSTIEWDAVMGNGIDDTGFYYDIFALRNSEFPFGPEVISSWWDTQRESRRKMEGTSWIPVWSAFGGLGIYKRESMLQSKYFGHISGDLAEDYKNILYQIKDHPEAGKYLSQEIGSPFEISEFKFLLNSWCYSYPTCCEHVTFHASMRLKGFGKIWINPQMIIEY